jgi:hypothetical protein
MAIKKLNYIHAKKVFITFLILTFCIAKAHCQQNLNHNVNKETAIYGGLSINSGDTAKKNSYILELGIWKSKYPNHFEPKNFNYYIGNELLINDSRFAIGPKIGGYVGFWMLCIGSDLIYYTNFKDNALRLAPYFGLGNHSFKLTFNFFINVTNKDFRYTHPLSLNFSYQLKSLKMNK